MSVITFDFSPKGGPETFSGTWSDGLVDKGQRITWPDGNVWEEVASYAAFAAAWPEGDDGTHEMGLFLDPNHAVAGSMAGMRFIADLAGGDGHTLAMVRRAP